MSIFSLGDFNENAPWVDNGAGWHRTVTAQGARYVYSLTRGGDFYLATTGDLDMATSGDFLMAMDKLLR